MEPNAAVTQPINSQNPPVIRKQYVKPALQRLGLLRHLTRFSF